MQLANLQRHLTPPLSRQLQIVGWAILLVALISIGARLRVLTTVSSDFAQDYLAGRALLAGRSIYDLFTPADFTAIGLAPNSMYNFHPPTTIALMLPLALLPYQAAIVLWTALCLGLYLITWQLLLRTLDVRPPRGLLPLLVGLSLLWFPLQFHVILGQLSIPMMACVVGSWAALRRGREGLAGALLAIAVLLKIFPGLLLLYLLLRGRWRAVAAAAAVGLAGLLLTLAVVGPGDMLRYRAEMAPENLREYASSPHNVSLHSVFSRLFTGDEYMAPLVEAPTVAAALTGAASLGLLGLLALAAWRAPRSSAGDDLAFALTCAAMPLLTPTSWSHGFVLLILPLALAWRAALADGRLWRLRLVGLTTLLISLPDVEIARLLAAYQPERVPWYAALIMLPTTAGLLLLFGLLVAQRPGEGESVVS